MRILDVRPLPYPKFTARCESSSISNKELELDTEEKGSDVEIILTDYIDAVCHQLGIEEDEDDLLAKSDFAEFLKLGLAIAARNSG